MVKLLMVTFHLHSVTSIVYLSVFMEQFLRIAVVNPQMHYGLTGGWVQKFKASYLAYFLQCALTDYTTGIV